MAIKFENVSFSYPNGFTANKNLNLVINSGERVAIIGQNGAGKTTAAKLMNGLYKPSIGSVTIDGINTKEKTTAQIARLAGYVFQNPDDQIFNQSVINEIEYMPRYFKIEKNKINKCVDEVLTLTELGEYKNANPFDIPYSIRKFVTIAAVMATKPKYIILDEPTAGQDYKRIQILKNIISHLHTAGVAVIVITHDMDFVIETFQRIIVMADKHIIADNTPENIFQNDEIIKKSCISRPQIGQITKKLNINDSIIFRSDLVNFLQKDSKEYHNE
ncbi:energy-coupling factor ABC transporter ATP-binding protein [Pectinatus sottacetonis]|uniref:energy-coupling factor ABC transporter ATP-binding protein n=1 Tax=Pectinatus sottacetonis TaxID=1002795 RepID=UPI0018C83372|nr:ABC transporter ATP-binding protein [Pectinatus sottacetonis]